MGSINDSSYFSGSVNPPGLSPRRFFTQFKSLTDVQSYVDVVMEDPAAFAILPRNAERAAAWLTDFRNYKFEENSLSIYPETKLYRYNSITVPVHSPLESLAYALSLVEPPDNAVETNWYESWAVCIARLIGIASPERGPVVLSILYPSPAFDLPKTWNSKYLVGVSIALRLVDNMGQLIPDRDRAEQARELIRRERCQFALKCGVVSQGESLPSDEPWVPSEYGVGHLVGMCGQHMPSCIILKTIPTKHATNFKRFPVNIDQITRTQVVNTEQEIHWKSFSKDTCMNCVDGHCNPAGFAAVKALEKTKK